jgi:membrane protein implicated in regulation of membrane protease activity
LTTFLLIGLAGLVLLGVSLLLGDLFDGFFDALAGDVFSSAVLGGFTSAFGFGAAITDSSGAPLAVSLPVGAVAGVAFGWFAAWFTRLVRDGGSDGTPEADDVLGREGTVDGFGTVRVQVGGHVVRLNARSEKGAEPGTVVHVTGVLSPTAVTVAPVWGELPPG